MLSKKKVLVSGASGFVGRALVEFLTLMDYHPIKLVRDKKHLDEHSIYWNPVLDTMQLSDFEGFYSMIHLAGEKLTGYWSQKKKNAIFLSRIRDTQLLSRLITRLSSPPQVLLTASAVGYYGNRGEELLTEESVHGEGFLAHVCVEWEKATQILDDFPIRVVHTRFGMILSPKGGMLKAIWPLFRYGLGCCWGNGQQWMSWISFDDLISSFIFILDHPNLSGSINIVSPNPIRNRDFTLQLTNITKQFISLPFSGYSIPQWMISNLTGEMGKELLLSSQKALPKRLLDAGFRFQHDTLSSFITP